MQLRDYLQKELDYFADIGFERITSEHTSYYLRWFQNHLVRRNLESDTPNLDADIISFVEWASSSKNFHYYIITHRARPIGHAGLKKHSTQNSTAELSCVIGEAEYIGTGIGIAAMIRFVDFVITHYPAITWFEITRPKSRSRRFFESLGFEDIGPQGERHLLKISKLQLETLLKNINL